MTKNEMLLKLLEQSGWIPTTETDEDGYRVAVPANPTKKGE
jgi:hypothetical protein